MSKATDGFSRTPRCKHGCAPAMCIITIHRSSFKINRLTVKREAGRCIKNNGGAKKTWRRRVSLARRFC